MRITTEQAAGLLGLPVWKFRRLVHAGKVKRLLTRGARGAWHFDLDDIRRHAREALDDK